MEKELLIIKEVQQMLNICRVSIYNWNLPRYKVGKRIFFDKNEIIDFVKQRKIA